MIFFDNEIFLWGGGRGWGPPYPPFEKKTRLARFLRTNPVDF